MVTTLIYCETPLCFLQLVKATTIHARARFIKTYSTTTPMAVNYKKNPVVVPHNNLTPWQNRCFDGFCPGAGISRVSALLLCSTLLRFSRPAFSALVLILIIPHWGLWGSKRSIIQRWSLRQLKALEEWLFIWVERQREKEGVCVWPGVPISLRLMWLRVSERGS